ncbi:MULTISPECIES: hypothetical protein [unclassified Oleiphilus]|jgi:uncharacterized membrane protein YgdD (TMEM256/DUF423 family)|uniref:hypothetical protein n=1 Tax=unclassified Oleiphilus TaxID=2631174 RepID=UPI0007C325B2|nr:MULTISPECIES: hypothetical protein [unclassified Oleiphilus]KZY41992.1 hypothetical protein A3732_17200 [Oleiphilus sp. HI0050]KZY76803.1 hypothetical protein A3740_11910 [Oleiphilus sp. HI0068]KZY87612.1 hypothetical protein A3741_13470 [Oleiphilus sp. HI0069]KZY89873.1 hypothetical protein A3743_07815 [Oleiphilus sp. HI0072]KZZ17194.1 hypothetical protein A3749_04255 [Oleiphilus sp. HI0078]KZZ20683.1 hypothetical protein A3752_11055 [Oleiphilus sp. HI0081]KZZ32458.1 hypothetical protein
MLVLSLLALIGVAGFGSFLLKNRIQKRAIRKWMITVHGLAASGASVLLILGLYDAHSADTTNSWNWVGLVLTLGVVIGSYQLFRKVLKGRSKPLILQCLHGVFAASAICVLAYSMII